MYRFLHLGVIEVYYRYNYWLAVNLFDTIFKNKGIFYEYKNHDSVKKYINAL